MNIFGLTIERTAKNKQEKFDKACKTIYDFNYRVIKQTEDKSKKIHSAAKATKFRAEKTKKKVYEAIEKIHCENLKLNEANIVRYSNVSRVSAKKYMNEFKENN